MMFKQLFVCTFLILFLLISVICVSLVAIYSSLQAQVTIVCAILIIFSSPLLTYFLRTLLYVGYYSWKHIKKKPNRYNILRENSSSHIVWLADIDIFLHMNNGRYRRAMDFARLIFFAECGLLDYFMETGTYALMAAATGRYRRPLKLFQKYDIVTKVVYWDKQNLYLEQRFVTKYKHERNYVYSINLVAMRTIQESPPALLRNFLGYTPTKPAHSPELDHFISFNVASSEKLKRESDN